MKNKVIQDYFDLSITDKLKDLEKKIDNIDKKIEKNFGENNNSCCKSDFINKINETSDINNNLFINIINELNSNINTKFEIFNESMKSIDNKMIELDNKIDSLNYKCENLKNNFNEIKQHFDNPASEYHRWLNTAIRTQIPVSFYTSKAINDLNKINKDKKNLSNV